MRYRVYVEGEKPRVMLVSLAYVSLLLFFLSMPRVQNTSI